MTTTTISNPAHAGIWHRTTHAFGKLWAKVIAFPDAGPAAIRRKAPPPEYFDFPPF